MKLQEMRQKTIKELQEDLKKTKKDLESIMRDLLQSKEKNVKKAVDYKKNIARMNTVITEKKILESLKNE